MTRFPFQIAVTDPYGRDRSLGIGTENGKVVTSTPPGEGFVMTPAQCDELIDALDTARRAARMQSEDAR